MARTSIDITSVFLSDIAVVIGGYAAELKDVAAVHGAGDRANALVALVRRMVDDCGFVVLDGQLSYYHNGIYHAVDPRWVISSVKGALMDAGVQPMDIKRMGNVAFVGLEQNVVRGSERLVCFGNGAIVDMVTCQRIKASRRNFVVRFVDAPWRDVQTTPRWTAFLDRVLPDRDCQAVLQEFLGLCFVDRGLISIEKFLIIIGTGANGKSVVFDVVRGVLGADNVSFLDPQQLCDPKQLAYADGRMINFSPDVRAGASFDSAIKSLSSGQDVNAWKLFKGSSPMRCPPLVFALNEMPKFLDLSGAFFRRLIVLRFGVTIPPRDQDRRLAAKIVLEEGAGVLQWMMEGARRLLSNGGEFTPCAAVDAECDALIGRDRVVEPDRAPVISDVPVPVSEPVSSFDAESWLLDRGFAASPTYMGESGEVLDLDFIVAMYGGDIDARTVMDGMERAGVGCYVEDGITYYKLYRR